jgi:microcystin-dependent protein
MPAGRVLGVYKRRLAAAVSSTVTTGATTVPVDSMVVNFDEEGGQFIHVTTGHVYDYESADFDLEEIYLTSALPGGRTLTADDALHVINPDGRRAFDYYANVAVDDVATDVVEAAVPEELQQSILEGEQKKGEGQLVIADVEGDQWRVDRLIGEEAPGVLVPGDLKQTFGEVAGGGVLQDGGWLKCDGSAVSRTTYAALFNRIGTSAGAGNGTTTFNVPDFRGRTMFGTGTQIALGQNDGKIEANRGWIHTHAITQNLHSHQINAVTHAGTQNTATTAPGAGANRVTAIAGNFDGQHDHSGATQGDTHDHSGATQGSNADPIAYMGVHVLIKV